MSQLRARLPIPWYPLSEVAQDFGCTPLNLVALADAGYIGILRQQVLGQQLDVITADDRAVLEGMLSSGERELRADARQSYAELIAALLVWLFADADALSKPDERTSEIEKYAATVGVPLTRSHKTYANIYREALAILLASGYIGPQEAANSTDPQRKIPLPR